MRGVLLQLSSDRSGALFRRRTAALVLVIAAHALLVLMLLRLAPAPPPAGPEVTTFELIPEPLTRTKAAAKPKHVTKQSERRSAVPAAPPPVPQPPELDIIRLTREEFAAADIAKLPSHQSDMQSAETADDDASAEVAGSGPNGERLYNAEWYREPTQAELSYYLPNGAPRSGWAIIACQTVANYRVDNCVELAQSPTGSGLAGAIRQAAWQFRVWPPRIGGRPLVGAWVRIRIEFTRDGTK